MFPIPLSSTSQLIKYSGIMQELQNNDMKGFRFKIKNHKSELLKQVSFIFDYFMVPRFCQLSKKFRLSKLTHSTETRDFDPSL